MLTVLKFVAVPGSLTLLALCVIVGVALMYFVPRRRRLWRNALAAVGVLYLILSLPVVATAITDRLTPFHAGSAPMGPFDSVIVFDGDNRRGRVAETTRLARLEPTPLVWVLGEQWMVDALGAAGIPADRLRHDSATPTTRAQTAWLAHHVAAHPGRRTVVVASRLQMPRVKALLAAAGLTVALAPSAIDDEPPTSGWRRFVPAYIALRASRDAIYELVAIPFYRWEGWID